MKYKRIKGAVIAAMMAAMLSTTPLMADVDSKYSKSYKFDSKGQVRLENINGDIAIEGWDKNEILLEYTIRADSKDDLERVGVDVKASNRHFSIEVDFEQSKKRWFSWGSNSGEVEFRLKVPNDAQLRMIDSVNGDISIERVAGNIKAETVNGEINIIGAAGDVLTDTVNGEISIKMSQFSDSQRIKSESVNGDIEVYLPENGGFRLEAETLNGDLSNDFGIEVDEGQYVGADMDGRYGDGNARLSFDTVNGDIEVNKK